jgi:hypothetical protein
MAVFANRVDDSRGEPLRVETVCHGAGAPSHAGPVNEKARVKRITAALRDLTPEQRKIVAVELAALDAAGATLGSDYEKAFEPFERKRPAAPSSQT